MHWWAHDRTMQECSSFQSKGCSWDYSWYQIIPRTQLQKRRFLRFWMGPKKFDNLRHQYFSQSQYRNVRTLTNNEGLCWQVKNWLNNNRREPYKTLSVTGHTDLYCFSISPLTLFQCKWCLSSLHVHSHVQRKASLLRGI